MASQTAQQLKPCAILFNPAGFDLELMATLAGDQHAVDHMNHAIVCRDISFHDTHTVNTHGVPFAHGLHLVACVERSHQCSFMGNIFSGNL